MKIDQFKADKEQDLSFYLLVAKLFKNKCKV